MGQDKSKKKSHKKPRREKRKKRPFPILFFRLFLVALPLALWAYQSGWVQETLQEGLQESLGHAQFSSLGHLQTNSNPSKLRKGPSHDERVNRLLRLLDEQIEWETARIDVENHHYAPSLPEERRQHDMNRMIQDSINFGIIEQEQSRLSGIGNSEQSRALDDKIDQRLWKEQVAESEYENAREEYVKQFVENARRAGYHVVLDRNLRVSRVKKVRAPHRTY